MHRAPSRGQRKNIEIFKEWVTAEAAAHSLCGCGQTVLFHGRQDAKIALDSAGVVVMNIAVDHQNKLVFAGKSLHISHDPSVIQVQNGAEVDLVDCNALIPLELSHIAQPLLVGLVCMKLPVQDILRSKLGILSRSGTAMVAVLDGRFDVPLAFDTSHLFFYAYL